MYLMHSRYSTLYSIQAIITSKTFISLCTHMETSLGSVERDKFFSPRNVQFNTVPDAGKGAGS